MKKKTHTTTIIQRSTTPTHQIKILTYHTMTATTEIIWKVASNPRQPKIVHLIPSEATRRRLKHNLGIDMTAVRMTR